MIGDSALTAFQTASGMTPTHLSIVIRTILLGLVLCWGGWCMNGLLHYCRHHTVDEFDVVFFIMRVSIQIVLIIILVFVK